MNSKTSVAMLSVISNTFLTLGKIIVGLLSGSVSILSEGIHSGLDLVAAIMAFFAVKYSAKPADKRHAYGHGKIENVSGTIEALLIFIAALWIIFEAVKKLTSGIVTIEKIELGLIVMAVSAILNFFVSNKLMKVAKRTRSVALEADALHLRTDVYTSAGVFIGLLLVHFTGWTILDPLIAIVVAVFIIKAAFDLTKEAFMPLVDVQLEDEEYNIIIEELQKHANSYVEFHNLRTRRSGPERHIDLHLVVPRFQSIHKVHALCDQIEEDIRKRLPGTHILIHSEPCHGKGDESCWAWEEGDSSCDKCKVQKDEV